MEMVIDREHDPCSVRICVCMWMLVMCILFVAMGLYARDMDIFHVHTTHMWEVIGYCAVHVLMYTILGCGLADHFWSVGKLGFLFQRSVRRHCFWNATWLLQASGHWVGNGLGSVLVSVYMYIVLYVCHGSFLEGLPLCVFPLAFHCRFFPITGVGYLQVGHSLLGIYLVLML